MSTIFEQVNAALHPRLDVILPEFLPGGKVSGREYVCGSLQGESGDSCKTNLDSGKGSDFATGESWGDVIGLWAKVRGIRQGEAAKELADQYGIHLDDAPRTSKATPAEPATPTEFTLITPVPDSAPEPPRRHSEHGRASTFWRYTVLSWHPDDKVTPEQEERVMDDFERVAFAGLEPDQRNILWVRHSHAGHHELHFVIPRVELASGKSFNAFPPGWEKAFGVFRDLHNHREHGPDPTTLPAPGSIPRNMPIGIGRG